LYESISKIDTMKKIRLYRLLPVLALLLLFACKDKDQVDKDGTNGGDNQAFTQHTVLMVCMEYKTRCYIINSMKTNGVPFHTKTTTIFGYKTIRNKLLLPFHTFLKRQLLAMPFPL